MKKTLWLVLFATVFIACNPTAKKTPQTLGAASGGDRGSVIPPSWTVANWYYDGANTTGCASDNNNCTQSTCGAAGSFQGPCLTYAETAARWGTYSPRLRQITNLTFLSSQSTTVDSDPVYFHPYLENGAYVVIAGTPTVVSTGSLSGVVMQNRATQQLWQATFGPSLSAGQFVVDSASAAEFWLYANAGGNAWKISEPLPIASVTVLGKPLGTTAAQLSISNSDSYSVLTFPSVNVTDVEPYCEQFAAAPFNACGVFIYNINVISPGGAGDAGLILGGQVALVDSISQRYITGGAPKGVPVRSATSGNSRYTQELYNAFSNLGILTLGTQTSQVNGADGYAVIFGGILGGVSAYRLGNVALQQDVILGAASNGIFVSAASSRLSGVYIESGMQLNSSVGILSITTDQLGNNATVWGPGALAMNGSGHIIYPAGVGQAVASMLFSGGLTLNGKTTACSSSGAATDVISCGITLSAGNLDLANSGVSTGFGGNAFIPGGASVSNF